MNTTISDSMTESARGLHVAVWSPYKPLEKELCKLISTVQGVEVLHNLDLGQFLRETHPDCVDIAVIEVDQAPGGAYHLVAELCRSAPKTKVIALSTHRDQRIVWNTLRAGAIAYVLKDCAFEDVPRALRAAVLGQRFLSPALELDGGIQ